jgi:hypothetical protein
MWRWTPAAPPADIDGGAICWPLFRLRSFSLTNSVTKSDKEEQEEDEEEEEESERSALRRPEWPNSLSLPPLSSANTDR